MSGHPSTPWSRSCNTLDDSHGCTMTCIPKSTTKTKHASKDMRQAARTCCRTSLAVLQTYDWIGCTCICSCCCGHKLNKRFAHDCVYVSLMTVLDKHSKSVHVGIWNQEHTSSLFCVEADCQFLFLILFEDMLWLKCTRVVPITTHSRVLLVLTHGQLKQELSF